MKILLPEKLTCRGRVNHNSKVFVLGEKSSKADRKNASQKQAVAGSAADKKKAAFLSKHAAHKQESPFSPTPARLDSKSGATDSLPLTTV